MSHPDQSTVPVLIESASLFGWAMESMMISLYILCRFIPGVYAQFLQATLPQVLTSHTLNSTVPNVSGHLTTPSYSVSGILECNSKCSIWLSYQTLLDLFSWFRLCYYWYIAVHNTLFPNKHYCTLLMYTAVQYWFWLLFSLPLHWLSQCICCTLYIPVAIGPLILISVNITIYSFQQYQAQLRICRKHGFCLSYRSHWRLLKTAEM